jgi:hypothetical protein
MSLKIKLYSTSNQIVKTRNCLFDPLLDDARSDGVLIFYDKFPERVLFPQKTFIWSPEPSWHSMYRTKRYKAIFKKIPLGNHLSFREKNPEQRIPHQTHINEKIKIFKKTRGKEIGAIVSNFGDFFWPIRPSFILRNFFITRKAVKLFGKYDSWKYFPHRLFPKKFQKPPKNYCGEIGGWVYDDLSTIRRFAKFHSIVCFENSYEPFYFTEKLVFAVSAGCIPIYNAHPTVIAEYLKGCFYLDPKEYNFLPKAVFKKALECSLESVWEQNDSWLKSFFARQDGTSERQVWERVGDFLAKRIKTNFSNLQ